MQVRDKDIESLLKLQEVDIIAANARRAFAALPQREQLESLSAKKKAVNGKRAEVQKLHDTMRRSIARINDEEELLRTRQAETQARIDAAGGDYRAIESLTKDLDGMAKRLSKLDEELADATDKLDQVSAAAQQLEAAVAAIDKSGTALTKEFNEKAFGLKQQVEESQATHEKIATSLPDDLRNLYETALRRHGGVALCQLQDNRCSACRSTLEQNRLLQVRHDAPLTECPNCHRLMIVGASS